MAKCKLCDWEGPPTEIPRHRWNEHKDVSLQILAKGRQALAESIEKRNQKKLEKKHHYTTPLAETAPPANPGGPVAPGASKSAAPIPAVPPVPKTVAGQLGGEQIATILPKAFSFNSTIFFMAYEAMTREPRFRHLGFRPGMPPGEALDIWLRETMRANGIKLATYVTDEEEPAGEDEKKRKILLKAAALLAEA